MARTWSKAGNLISDGNTNQALTLQATFPEPANYTVQFNKGAGSSGKITKAQLTWSVSGNAVTRTIDVVDGTSISGSAEAVHVRVYDASAAPISAESYQVGIQISKGTRSSVQQPPYLSMPIIQTGGPTTVFVPVPSGAGVISVMVNYGIGGVLANPYDLQVEHSNGVGVQKQYSPVIQPGWVPLAAGTSFINLTNQGTAPGVVVWSVTFGIDG